MSRFEDFEKLERRGRYEPIGWGEGKKRKGRRK